MKKRGQAVRLPFGSAQGERSPQAGQAFILTLVLLAIGALLIMPALRLSDTSLKSSQVVTQRARMLYAADAGQEYVMWKLLYDTAWRDASLGEDGATGYLNFDLCGISVSATVVMRAVPGRGGVTLSTDDIMRPTKTVSASNPVSPDTPDRVANRTTQTFTYIIRMEQLSSNTSQKLEQVYDILPKGFGTGKYVANSSYIRVDGGTWQSIGNPLAESSGYGGQERLRWPASGNFTSPIRHFNVRQVKELKFQIALTLPSSADNSMFYNYVVLKVGNITTFSGQQAPITVGNGSKLDADGMLTVTKTSFPSIIMPGEETPVRYTVNMTNGDASTHQISRITDNLPPDFFYSANTTSGITTNNPAGNPPPLVEMNGVYRQQLVWNFSPQVSITSGQTLSLVFWALATKDVSGSYYNEVLVDSNFGWPAIFQDIGVTQADFNSTYSWNSGSVTVPAYDSRTEAEDVVIDANLALQGVGSISITSYQVR